ncbi:4-hydroxyphenylpyruvate dioxygenase [Streptomyces coacervatus]|uniref:4-hydroxyphenylpyruvate dioxygenase n=1 Tax=Streptomyces coacervatus TaxID=647381 RepID=A0ABP7GJW6_9ACTN|nr:4-hydroxyphenylpyruvate dioxygenase [Streptomyces coacervatus]MDF2265063.1 4-hydroxyphenylpyruvate dioxygenase [Streptomyces coacervatus]
MAVREIEYVELYARDKQAMADYFVSSLGFARVADSVGADRSSVLLRQGDVQLLVTSGPGTWKFLDQHGDGVADIALTCDDVTKTCNAVEAAGGRLAGTIQGNPIVQGFGGVSHTLLPDGGGDGPGARLPGGRTWAALPGASTRPAGRIRLLDHVAVCLEGGSLSEYADYYGDAFGLSRYSSEYVDTGEQGMDSIVVRSASGRITFTLVAPDPAKSPGQLDAFLDRNGGPGVQHLAFLVDDIIPAVSELRGRGVEFLSTPSTYYDMLAERFADMREEITGLRAAHVLADRDEWGYLLQLFSRSPYERNTLFYELIQRQGSRGFGSANIRALYEAVERDRLAAT